MDDSILSARPWLKGSIELLEHAAHHYRLGSPADLRFAMIHVDNAVELAGRLYLKMEARLQDTLTGEEMRGVERYFDKLMRYLTSQLALDNLTRSNIEYFHEIRNDLYHNGNGISVDPKIVASYITTATKLLEQMYGAKVSFSAEVPESDFVSPVVTKTAGELPPELVNSYKRRFLGMKILKGMEEAVRLRYAIAGYQTEKQSALRSQDRLLRSDLICRKGDELIIVEVRNLEFANADVFRMLVHQRELFENALSNKEKVFAKFTIHTISPRREREIAIHMLERAGWEIEDWRTTLRILSENGLEEKAKPLQEMLEEYISLQND